MAKAEKVSATPEQQAALGRIIKSFNQFEDVIIEAIAGRGDIQQGLWWVYFCSLRAELGFGKVHRGGQRVRKGILAKLARYIGHTVTAEDFRTHLTGPDDECVIEAVQGDIERLASVPATRPRSKPKRRPSRFVTTWGCNTKKKTGWLGMPRHRAELAFKRLGTQRAGLLHIAPERQSSAHGEGF
jgi:hypothetical protein